MNYIYGLDKFIKDTFHTDDYIIRKYFPMLHAGWESDYVVALVEINGETHAIGSNHGSPCILNKEDLLTKASEYADVLAATIDATRKLK